MPSLYIHLEVKRSDVFRIEQICESLGCLSTGLIPKYDPIDEQIMVQPDWVNAKFEVYFPIDTDVQRFQAELAELEINVVDVRFIGDQDWVKEWRQTLKPLEIGRLYIVPRDHRVEESHRKVIRLEPGLAFGTGTHESTALCLKWLDAISLKGKSVLDAGCGSGILAIAAAKLGASSVVAVDIEQQALDATEENAQFNEVEIETRSDFEIELTFDVIVANISSQTLIDLAPEFERLSSHGSKVALAGILESQVERVTPAYTFLQLDPVQQISPWALISGSRSL